MVNLNGEEPHWITGLLLALAIMAVTVGPLALAFLAFIVA